MKSYKTRHYMENILIGKNIRTLKGKKTEDIVESIENDEAKKKTKPMLDKFSNILIQYNDIENKEEELSRLRNEHRKEIDDFVDYLEEIDKKDEFLHGLKTGFRNIMKNQSKEQLFVQFIIAQFNDDNIYRIFSSSLQDYGSSVGFKRLPDKKRRISFEFEETILKKMEEEKIIKIIDEYSQCDDCDGDLFEERDEFFCSQCNQSYEKDDVFVVSFNITRGENYEKIHEFLENI